MIELIPIFKEAVKRYGDDECSRFGASLAYYSVFSLAPLLVIAIGIAGWVFGTTAAEDRITREAAGVLGEDGAAFLGAAVQATADAKRGAGMAALGLFLLLMGAGGVFREMKDALNRVFDAPPARSGLLGFLRKNLLSFGMVLATGFLLLISLLLSAAVSALGAYFEHLLPLTAIFWEALNLLVSFGIGTGLFILLYRFVPDVRLSWEDIVPGALVTAALFTVGKSVLGIYLGQSGATSAYGAAGSLVLILLWVFYSAQIMLFGAEVTVASAARKGRTNRK